MERARNGAGIAVVIALTLAGSAQAASLTDGATATSSDKAITFQLTQDQLEDTVADARYVPDASLIVTENDFSAYEVPMVRKDPNIVSIAAGDNSVSMEYRTPAKFLGVFNTHATTKAVVSEDGSIELTHPGDTFLYDTDDALDANIKDSIESEIGDLLDVAAPSGALPLSLRAQMLDRIHDAFVMNLNAESGE